MTMTDDEPTTAQHWFCPTCGEEIDAREECESWPCAGCGTTMQPQTRRSEYIHVDDLESLIEEWQSKGIQMGRRGHHEASGAFKEYVDGLEELIEERR